MKAFEAEDEKADHAEESVKEEKVKEQDEGYTLPEIYSLVRCGFNIVDVERPHWWTFGRRGRTLTICAQKKTWKTVSNTYRPYL